MISPLPEYHKLVPRLWSDLEKRTAQNERDIQDAKNEKLRNKAWWRGFGTGFSLGIALMGAGFGLVALALQIFG